MNIKNDIFASVPGIPIPRFALLAMLVLSLIPSVALAQAPQAAKLTVSGGLSGAPGDVVTATIDLTGRINVDALSVIKFAVAVDPDVLVPLDAAPGSLLNSWPGTDFSSVVESDRLVINALTDPGVAVADGELFVVRFTVADGAIDGATSAISIVGVEAGQAALLQTEVASDPVKVATFAGDATVVGGLVCTPGDANPDGEVNVADAVVVLRIVTDLVTPTPLQECNADFDEDGDVDTGDAVRILRSIVGLPLERAFAQVAVASIETRDGRARLLIDADAAYGLQIAVPTRGLVGSLTSAAHGMRVDSMNDGVYRMAWASERSLSVDGRIVVDLPVDADARLAEVRLFDANGAEVDVQVRGAAPVARESAVSLSNVPNPFNPSTEVKFEVGRAGVVRVELFNVRGERVVTLADGEFAAGEHRVMWGGVDEKGEAVSSGVYFARLVSAEGTASHRMLLLK